MPVRRDLCLALIKSEEWSEYPALEVQDVEQVQKMNEFSFRKQVSQKWGYVYSDNKEELNRLVSL